VNAYDDFININGIEEYKEKLSLCLQKGNIKHALVLKSYYQEIFSEDNDLNYIYSRISYLSGNIKDAIVYLNHCYLMNRNHLDTLNKLVEYYEELGYLEEARFFKSKSLALSNSNHNIGGFTTLTESVHCDKKRVLICSPIHQKPEILIEFLTSLNDLEKQDFKIKYFFIDDNIDDQSSMILKDFQTENNNVIIMVSNDGSHYDTSGSTHQWKEHLVWKVADFKDDMIDFAKINEYDYVFFIDSDIVLHPKTLEQLVNQRVDIISNIFWTKWSPEISELPQVWLKDQYTMVESFRNEIITEEERNRRISKFIAKLRIPGIYEVGGLGACTLISRYALEKGVSFKEISNLSFWGEDRHFCIRAAAIGLKMYVDTHLPALHLYRIEDLARVTEYKTIGK
jgi:GT2 family glycosyltransferase